MENKINPTDMDKFAKLIGARVTRAEPGYAEAVLSVTDEHLNGIGIVQGGVTYTLADFAFAAASNAGEKTTIGVSSTITYFKPPKGKTLRAEAREVSFSRKICNYCIDVYDEQGTYVARMSAMGYIRD